MLEALIAGERNPKALADLAIGKMRAKRGELAEALNGKFEDHHGELARMILDQIDALTAQIDQLSARAGELIAAIPAAWGVDADGATDPNPCPLKVVISGQRRVRVMRRCTHVTSDHTGRSTSSP